MAKKLKKIVLAYSGGLEHIYHYPLAARKLPRLRGYLRSRQRDQDSEIVGLEEKELRRQSAGKLYIEDIQDEFVKRLHLPDPRLVKYEGYLLGTSFARPLSQSVSWRSHARKALTLSATAAPVKGGDQVRFRADDQGSAPEMQIIAPENLEHQVP